MSKEIISDGNDFEIIQDDRSYGGVRTSVFKVDGKTGTVTANGKAIVGNETITGDETITGALSVGTTLAVTGASTLAAVAATTLALTGAETLTAIVAPSTPASGKGAVYVDSTSKNIAVKDDAGVVKHGVQTKAAVTNQFVTAISDAGVVAVAPIPSGAFLSFCLLGADASGGASNVAAVGVKVGDKVVMAANVTDHTNDLARFGATVTVVDQIPQLTTDLSAKTLVFLVIAQS